MTSSVPRDLSTYRFKENINWRQKLSSATVSFYWIVPYARGQPARLWKSSISIEEHRIYYRSNSRRMIDNSALICPA